MTIIEQASLALAVPHWYMYPPKSGYSDTTNSEAVEQDVALLAEGDVSVYVHIPFCTMKCTFCSLFSSTGVSDRAMSDYSIKLMGEIANFGRRLKGDRPKVSVLYFGGGTPALLPETALIEVLAALNRIFDMTRLRSATVEFSPDTVDHATAATWRRFGFNRASMGVQTFDDERLMAMSRRHTGISAKEAIKILAGEGYADVNADLIFGSSDQTSSAWARDLDCVASSGATQCTFHPLSTRPKTILERKAVSLHDHADAQSVRERHSEAIAHFETIGWRQTSAISFSSSSSGNPLEMAEAAGKPTIGFGAGSRSYYPNVHTSTVPYGKRIPFGAALRDYYDKVAHDLLPIASQIWVSEEERARRSLILQMHHGFVHEHTLCALQSFESASNAFDLMEGMIIEGWFLRCNSGYALTQRGSVAVAEIGLAFSSALVRNSLASSPRTKA